ncbi:MAG: NADH-quinone oxidoreductase subunit C [Acidobacteriota bacterium]
MATAPDGQSVRGLDQETLARRTVAILEEVGGQPVPDVPLVETFRDQVAVRIPASHSFAVLERLRDDEGLRFDLLVDVTCVHWPHRPAPLGAFDVVYHLVSIQEGHRVRLKVACPDPDEGVDSAVPLWESANLMEREARDMFGVTFRGHPDPRRILMSDDFDGWPLRKDFPYRGH